MDVKKKKKGINLEADWNKAQNITVAEKHARENDTAERNSKLPELRLTKISYRLMTEEDISKESVAEITSICKNESDSTENLIGTTSDPRLGTISNDKLCGSCGKTNEDCPGHLGHIKIPGLIIHPWFRKFVLFTLQSVCQTCGKLRIGEKQLREEGVFNLSGLSRLTMIAELSKKQKNAKQCSKEICEKECKKKRCGLDIEFKNTKAVNNDSVKMIGYIPGKKTEIVGLMPPQTILEIFKKISEKDAKILGFEQNHPKNFIINFIPVIPISARPPAEVNGEIVKNDLTKIYDEIIKRKDSYFRGNEEQALIDLIGLYNMLIVNKDQRSSGTADFTVLDDLISGKSGEFRQHLSGKRADYSGRGPIGPNKDLRFGEIALASFFRTHLTTCEIVTYYNIERLEKYQREGKLTYITYGSGDAKRLTGSKLRLTKEKFIPLQLGDTVERFMEEGDVIIFNRQPTLQKNSMPAMRATFQNKFSTGLHLSVTKGLNADFDGDEGAVHVLRTSASRTEARTFMNSVAITMSAHNSRPEAGLVYNSVSGMYLLSKYGKIPQGDFLEGMKTIKDVPYHFETLEFRIKKLRSQGFEIENFTGKLLISLLFPPDFWYHYEDKENIVDIREGILLSGYLDKNTVGTSSNGLVQSIWKWYGQNGVYDFISNGTFLANWFVTYYGLTVGISDCMLGNEQDKLTIFIVENIKKINYLIENLPPLPEIPSGFEKKNREETVINIIEKHVSYINKFVSDKIKITNERGIPINNITIMADSGAKGKLSDTVNLIGLLGQMYVNSERPLKTLNRGKRWLTFFDIKDDSIESRGFCKNSYRTGLNPAEFFAQAQAGRVGLSDTAIKTSEIGSANRRMIKTQEDLKVTYNGTVINSIGNIYQLSYGAGLDPANMLRSNSKQGSKLLSFINIHEAVGRVNSKEGFNGSLKDVDMYRNLLSKYKK